MPLQQARLLRSGQLNSYLEGKQETLGLVGPQHLKKRKNKKQKKLFRKYLESFITSSFSLSFDHILLIKPIQN